MKVFFYKNYFPQVAVTNLSLSAGVSGSWERSVLDESKASHLAGAMWNGFEILRCQTVNSHKLITDKNPVTPDNSLNALYQMLEKCRGSLDAQLAALTFEPDKGRSEDKSNGDAVKGKSQPKKECNSNVKRGDKVTTGASKTKKSLQSVSLSTLNILLQNLEQSGEDFNQHF
jgi:hypothetical protein